MRERFPRGRRRPGPAPNDRRDFVLDPPPELPRTIETGAIRKAMPWVFGVVIIGMVGLMFMSGLRQINPMYLLFIGMMAIALFQSMQNQGGSAETPKSEVNSERGEYLRYLSGKATEIRRAASAQRASAEWSHPDPDVLEAVLGSSRMWERGPSDRDYLHLRVGRDEVKLTSNIKVKPGGDSDLDLEPVSMGALQSMRAVQQSIPHCPKAIDIAGFGMIAVYGDRGLFAAAVRAWICQLVVWHTPSDTAVAVAAPDHTALESRWGWAKWLLHTESHDLDGAGPARYLGTVEEVDAMLTPLLKDRAELVSDRGAVDASAVTKSHKHVVVVVDDPAAAPQAVRRIAARDGVTVIVYRDAAGPDRDYVPHGRELLLCLDQPDSGCRVARMRMWQNFRWKEFCAEPDLLDEPTARHLARRLTRWDTAPVGGSRDSRSVAAQSMLSLLNIANAAALDVEALWAPRMLPVGTGEPVRPDGLLQVPIGLQPGGAPLILDLKDEADGGNGPHGLMIGMTGSGKSTLLKAMAFALFARHSPDVVQAILVDFKDGAGFDMFADYPHVVATITNLEEKRSLVERFGDTLFGLLDARGRVFHDTGHQIKGAAFESLREYNEVRATPAGAHLPPMPYMFVWVDEFSLLLKDHPDMADVFDTVTRKGRSQGVFFLFASQTLDDGIIKRIPDNTQYRIGLKVASDSISRRVIGTSDAFNGIDGKSGGGRNTKGTGFFVRAPGAEPVKFRGFLLPDRYEPPTTITRRVIAAAPRARLFTAGRVVPDADDVIETQVAGDTVIQGPPKSLVLTVGPQLAQAYGKHSPQLWSPPLDDPIPLDQVLRAAEAAPARASAAPWWPLGEIDRPRLLSHGLLTYSLDAGNISILGMRGAELSTVVQTFVLAAASRYSPREIGFYALAYGGPELAPLKDLPHVGAVGGRDRKELTQRIFGDLDKVAIDRRRLFSTHNIGSLAEYRQRRSQGDQQLDDGYPTDIFLIVDGWENFVDDNTSLLNPKNPQIKNIERLIGAGHGIHLLITAADWIKLGGVVQSQLNCRWELKLANVSQSQVRARAEDKMIRPQDRIPADQRGRGINSSGDVIRFAVGRIDGKPTEEDLDAHVRHTITTIAAQHRGARRTPVPQLMPLVVDPRTLVGPDQLGAEQFTLGVRGRDLRPLVLDFSADPLLAVYGDDKSGKSTLIRHLLRNLVLRRRSPDDAVVCVFDIKRELGAETQLLAEGADYYETDLASIETRIAQIGQVLDGRKPPTDQGWQAKRDWRFDGPPVYVFIDDLDALPQHSSMHQNIWTPLIRNLPTARDIGLRVIVTRRAAGMAVAESSVSGLTPQFTMQNANRILLGSRSTSEKVGGVKFEEDLPPGRGYMLAADEDNTGYVQLAAVDHQLLPQC